MSTIGAGSAADLPVITSVIRHRWATSVFGIVAPGEVRRRPSDVARVVGATVLVGLFAAGAGHESAIESRAVDLLAALPDVLAGPARFGQALVGIVAGAVVVVTLVARRWRLAGTLVLAAAVAGAVAVALDAAVDLPDALTVAARDVRGHGPSFPIVALATSLAVIRTARPFLTRPVRRLLEAVVWSAALGALYLCLGTPGSVLATVALSWGAAAAAHLVLGSPGGTPSSGQVRTSLAEFGVPVDELHLDPDQDWGRTNFSTDDGLAVQVIGRDSTDARLFAKLWRFVWYKDSGPTLSLRRDLQLEHDALVLLLAERSGAAVPHLVAVGTAGARDDALLVVRDPAGPSLTAIEPDDLGDDLLDGAWATLGRLHAARIAHGEATAGRFRRTPDGPIGLVRFEQAEMSADDDHLRLDEVHLLVSSAAHVGPDRALAAAGRALGVDGVAALLPLLEPAALTARARGEVEDLKGVLRDLREGGAAFSSVTVPDAAALRRFSVQGIVLAGAFALGVYLLVAQLADVAAMGDIFKGAGLGWVATTFVLAQIPQFWLAVAMLGAVSAPLPLRQVTVVQFANAFTGLVGGTAGNATLVIRFFQRQGLPASVSVSSGLLNSAAGFVVQIVIVVVGLLLTGSSFELEAGGFSLPGWLLALAAVVAVAVLVIALVPTVRRRIKAQVESQVHAAIENLRGVLATPRKAVQLFGGNLGSQLFFALTLGAALHAYGSSLPLSQIIIVNALASFVGGAAPVPGGMGVVEAGLIGGFTAAGVSEVDAVAATFTARLFTSYLPPIWGWFAFRWLQRNELV